MPFQSAAELVAIEACRCMVGTHSRVGELGGRRTKDHHHHQAAAWTGCQLGEASQ